MPSTTQRVGGRKRRHIAEFKAERGCARCGERHPACLELHHPDPSLANERMRGAHRVGWENLSWADLRVELEKVVVLCANCHRKDTAERMGWFRYEGIEFRPLGPPPKLTIGADKLRRLYEEQLLTDKVIGEQNGCTYETVRRWRATYGIPTIARWDRARRRRRLTKQEVDELTSE